MTSRRSHALWRLGHPLNSAWLELAEDKDARAVFQEFDSNLLTVGALDAAKDEASVVGRVLTFVGSLSAGYADRSKSEHRLKQSLLSRLEDGELLALGYRERPSVGRSPVEVPKTRIAGAAINWEAAEISGFGSLYGRVRVFDPATKGTKPPAVRKGRPGSGVAIRGAIQELQLIHGTSLCEMPRANACELIRRKITDKHVPGDGLSDINLAKYLREFCPSRNIV